MSVTIPLCPLPDTFALIIEGGSYDDGTHAAKLEIGGLKTKEEALALCVWFEAMLRVVSKANGMENSADSGHPTVQ